MFAVLWVVMVLGCSRSWQGAGRRSRVAGGAGRAGRQCGGDGGAAAAPRPVGRRPPVLLRGGEGHLPPALHIHTGSQTGARTKFYLRNDLPVTCLDFLWVMDKLMSGWAKLFCFSSEEK